MDVVVEKRERYEEESSEALCKKLGIEKLEISDVRTARTGKKFVRVHMEMKENNGWLNYDNLDFTVFLYENHAMPFIIRDEVVDHMREQVGFGVQNKYLISFVDDRGRKRTMVEDRPFSQSMRERVIRASADGKFELGNADEASYWTKTRNFWGALTPVICLKLIEMKVLDRKAYEERIKERRNRYNNNTDNSSNERNPSEEKKSNSKQKKSKSKSKSKKQKAEESSVEDAAKSIVESEVPAETSSDTDVPY